MRFFIFSYFFFNTLPVNSKTNFLSFLTPDLATEIFEKSSLELIPKGTEILRTEQYVKVLPIVIDGLIKVYSRFNEKELYFLQMNKFHEYSHLKKSLEKSKEKVPEKFIDKYD